jgi:excisionase family DNA binding protein
MPETFAEPRGWLTVREAATHLRVTTNFIRNLLWDGQVPFTRAGRRFIVDSRDLDHWAETNKERNGN